MKGWKTIIFNALMLLVGLTGAHVDPALVGQFAEEFVTALAIGNGILRSITSTPIFNNKAADAGRTLKGLAVAALCLFVMGCTERIDALTGTGIEERCQDYRAGLAALDVVRLGRDLTPDEASRRQTYEGLIVTFCPPLPPLPPGS